MNTALRRRTGIAALVGLTGLALTGCATSDPLETDGGGSSAGGGETIVVGSQDYYSNEIIAEIYAQALEGAGYEVERQFRVGQREAYMPALENGEIDLFPEYTGNLLQYFEPSAEATESQEVYDALVAALPEGLAVLAQSPASDQDSYNVTAEFAEQNGLTSLADLAEIEGLVLGGAPELEERPYGPSGLAEIYGADVAFEPTGDTTVESLLEGIVNVANVYSADPAIAQYDLVTLEDPEGMFLASHVVPVVSEDLADELAEIIDPVNEALTAQDLTDLNLRSVEEQQNAATLASEWLADAGLVD